MDAVTSCRPATDSIEKCGNWSCGSREKTHVGDINAVVGVVRLGPVGHRGGGTRSCATLARGAVACNLFLVVAATFRVLDVFGRPDRHCKILEKIVIPPGNELLQVVGNVGSMLNAAQSPADSSAIAVGYVGCGGI